jgi:hypothetical protein
MALEQDFWTKSYHSKCASHTLFKEQALWIRVRRITRNKTF